MSCKTPTCTYMKDVDTKTINLGGGGTQSTIPTDPPIPPVTPEEPTEPSPPGVNDTKPKPIEEVQKVPVWVGVVHELTDNPNDVLSSAGTYSELETILNSYKTGPENVGDLDAHDDSETAHPAILAKLNTHKTDTNAHVVIQESICAKLAATHVYQQTEMDTQSKRADRVVSGPYNHNTVRSRLQSMLASAGGRRSEPVLIHVEECPVSYAGFGVENSIECSFVLWPKQEDDTRAMIAKFSNRVSFDTAQSMYANLYVDVGDTKYSKDLISGKEEVWPAIPIVIKDKRGNNYVAALGLQDKTGKYYPQYNFARQIHSSGWNRSKDVCALGGDFTNIFVEKPEWMQAATGYSGSWAYVFGGIYNNSGIPEYNADVYRINRERRIPHLTAEKFKTPCPIVATVGFVFEIDGVVYVGGGEHQDVANVKVYRTDDVGATWARCPDLPCGVIGGSVVTVGNVAYLVGGFSDKVPTESSKANRISIFNPDTHVFKPVEACLFPELRDATVIGESYHRLITVFGGLDRAGDPVKLLHVFTV